MEPKHPSEITRLEPLKCMTYQVTQLQNYEISESKSESYSYNKSLHLLKSDLFSVGRFIHAKSWSIYQSPLPTLTDIKSPDYLSKRRSEKVIKALSLQIWAYSGPQEKQRRKLSDLGKAGRERKYVVYFFIFFNFNFYSRYA